MVDEKGKEVVPPEKGKQPPTLEEQLKTLQAQLQQATSEKERLEGGYKGLQKKLAEKDELIQRQVSLDSRIAGIEDRIELLATAITTGGKPNDEGAEEAKPDVMKVLRQQRQEQETKRKQEEWQARANSIYTKAEEVYGEDDIDALSSIRSLIRNGDLDLAEKKIAKVEKSKVAEVKEKTPILEKAKEDVEEVARKILEERGQLATDLGGAGGSGTGRVFTAADIDKMSAEEYKKHFPSYEDLLKAQNEGRIK